MPSADDRINEIIRRFNTEAGKVANALGKVVGAAEEATKKMREVIRQAGGDHDGRVDKVKGALRTVEGRARSARYDMDALWRDLVEGIRPLARHADGGERAQREARDAKDGVGEDVDDALGSLEAVTERYMDKDDFTERDLRIYYALAEDLSKAAGDLAEAEIAEV